MAPQQCFIPETGTEDDSCMVPPLAHAELSVYGNMPVSFLGQRPISTIRNLSISESAIARGAILKRVLRAYAQL